MALIWIGFSKPRKFKIGSFLIRLIEGTSFSHAFIKVRSESLDRNLIYEATGSGVYFIGEVNFTNHAEIVKQYQLTISPEQKTKLLQWAIDTSGKPYGVIQLLGLAIKRFCLLFGVKISNPLKTGKKAYICTELVAEALEEFGLFADGELEEVGLIELQEKVEIAYGQG